MRRLRACQGGTNTVELGPALFIIFVLVLFPMIDLMYIATGYAAGWYLNHLCVREVACHSPATMASVNQAISTAETAWSNSMLAGLIGKPSVSDTAQFIVNGVTQNAPAPPTVIGGVTYTAAFCIVTTRLSVKPFLQVPFLNGIPGIGAPVPFSYVDQRPQEETGQQ